ncbi:MAG: OsmC family protein [Gemmatirosa sp.]
MEPDRVAPIPAAVPGNDPGDANGGPWVATRIAREHYRTEVRARTHALVLDEPTDVGGTDSGATPYEHLLAALGGCTAITLRMYADRKGWPMEAVEVRLRTARAHQADCEACETEDVGPHRLERRIVFDGPLTDEQRRRLLLIADRCPVKQTLQSGIRIVDAAP